MRLAIIKLWGRILDVAVTKYYSISMMLNYVTETGIDAKLHLESKKLGSC